MANSQQINLYVAALRRDPPPLHPQMMLEIVIIVLVLLIAWGGINVWRASQLEAGIQVATAKNREIDQQLQVLRSQRPADQNAQLDLQITQLRKNVERHREISQLIQSQNLGNAAGFSSHMTGLARQHETNVALTGFALLAGGGDVRMTGETNSPETVPRYLGKLRSEPALLNARFGVLTIERESPAVQRWYFQLGPDFGLAEEKP